MNRRFLWIAVCSAVASSPQISKAEDTQPDHVFVMPPFLVEDEKVKGLGRPEWTYAEAYGLEVLSACNDFNTELFIQRMKRRQTELALIIPDQFLQQTAAPTTIILIPTTLESARIETMIRQLEDVPGTTSMSDSFRPVDALRLSDLDSHYLFVVKENETSNDIWLGPRGLISLTYIYDLVKHRTPALPDWFCVGITRLFRQYIISRPQSEIRPDEWPQEDADSLLNEHPDAPGPLLPMSELFIPWLPEGKSEAYRRVWEAQSGLFARWAFTESIHGSKEGLWRFANAAATQPVTEELFRSCFGIDYAAARKSLGDYISKFEWKSVDIPYPEIPIHDIDIKEATPEQIQRIKGEWARRIMRIVRERYPKSYPSYVSEAGNLLEGAYKRGERDPMLISTLALFRIDTGDIKGGQTLLEQNPKAVAARPLAGIELAQFHMLDALKNPAGLRQTLSEDQATKIIGEVSATLRQSPPMQSAYVLAAKVSLHLDRDPTALERRRLNEGASLFSSSPELLIQSSAWDLRAGDVAEARRLIDLGLWEIADPPARQKLLALDKLALEVSTPSK